MSTSPIQPDPSAIGGIPKAPLAFMPNTARLFKERAVRLERLAENSRLAPYLTFLAGLVRIQSDLVDALPTVDPIPAEQVERAREAAMPPLDRSAIGQSAVFRETLKQFLDRAEALDKPAAAAEALAQVQLADEATLDWMVENIAADNLPIEALAQHLYVAAAIQIHAARLAGGLDAAKLVPIQVGVCPTCGGKPVASMVIGFQGAEGTRYAGCSCCGTLWNEVRVKCLACGSTKGIGYRAVESGTEDATVKAEVCDTCHSWVKILYQNKNPSVEMVADDVASLGLDLLMKDTEYKRAGFNPFLIGY
ncbi:formate dehydrogenase accessory protein FdhE [Tianweitania sp. BSSL-BM11]|uniref:Protein FdhE homolog n=1 Tax=Tianweitania aestuarii TaxID=2814886 RepID=A0ABS5RRK3_9HYPH|nr:formate dehydrogenase accessory protein FdhE [Tianweitania aestuarii]MBS9719614.1 formate dehydrogenase accessory protein FdhE [Tianweitania aestuarii]